MNSNAAQSLRVGLATLALVAASLSTAAIASPVQAASSASFSSPSKNIGCYMNSSSVRCDILVYTYHPTRKPAACHFDWGHSVGVGTTGKGHFRCVSDTVAGSPKILRYGSSKTIGRYTCTSRITGMTCINTRNGHGFRISKASYSLF